MIVYWDMDGVLTDFEKTYFEKVGSTKSDDIESGEYADNMRALVKTDFFNSMLANPHIEDIKRVMRTINKAGIRQEILTSCGPWAEDNTKTIDNKTKWLIDNKIIECGIVKVNTVSLCSDKKPFASPDAILIDDQINNISDFKSAGGNVVHFNIKDTKKHLSELLEDLK